MTQPLTGGGEMRISIELGFGVAFGEVMVKLYDEGQAWLRDHGGKVRVSAAERNLVVLTPCAERGYTPCQVHYDSPRPYTYCHIQKTDETACLPRCRYHDVIGHMDEEDGSLYIELPAVHLLPFPRVTRSDFNTYDVVGEFSRVIRNRAISWKASGDPTSTMQKPDEMFHELLPGLWAQMLKETGLLR